MAAIIASYAVRLMMRLVRASQALRFLRAVCAEAFLGRLYVYDSSFVCMTGRLCCSLMVLVDPSKQFFLTEMHSFCS